MWSLCRSVIALVRRDTKLRNGLILLFPLLAAWAMLRTAPRLLQILLIGAVIALIVVELRPHFRRSQRFFGIKSVQLSRSIAKLRRVPPDVPICYGAAAISMLFSLGVLATGKAPRSFTLGSHIAMALVALGTIRYGASVVAVIAKWAWSRAAGKTAYAAAFSIAVWLAGSDAAQFIRYLTRAEAKYFPSFFGLMSSVHLFFRALQFWAALLLCCACVLMLWALAKLVLGFAQLHWRQAVEQYRRLGSPLGQAVGGSRSWTYEPLLPQLMALLMPLGVAIVGGTLYGAAQWGMEALHASPIAARLLAEMEYAADGDCANLSPDAKTVHLGDKYVSTLTEDGGQFVFGKQVCRRSLDN